MDKKIAALVSLILISQMVTVNGVAVFHLSSYIPVKHSRFALLFSGTPDAYGNRIAEVEILQDTGGGAYVSRGSVNYSDYNTNYEIEGVLNQTTKFVVTTWLNYSFVGSVSAAKTSTEVYISVSGELTKEKMTVESATLQGVTRYIVKSYYVWDEEGKPDAKDYDVTIEYYAAGPFTVSNPADLDIDDPTDWVFREAGYVEVYGASTATKTGFMPLHAASAFTIVAWFSTTTVGGYQFVVDQYVSSGQTSVIFWLQYTVAKARVGDGTTYVDVSSSVTLEVDNVYCSIFRWDKDYDGGKLSLTINGTTSTSASGITSVTSCADDLYLASKQGASQFFAGSIYEISIYPSRISDTACEDIYAHGPDFLGGQPNNSWTMNEALLGLDEAVVHDGEGVFGEREQWDLDFRSQSYSSFLFPWWGDEPVLYLWLFGILLLFGGGIYPAVLVRKQGWTKEAVKYWALGIAAMAIGWALFVGL